MQGEKQEMRIIKTITTSTEPKSIDTTGEPILLLKTGVASIEIALGFKKESKETEFFLEIPANTIYKLKAIGRKRIYTILAQSATASTLQVTGMEDFDIEEV
jgi:hypothetical protein